MTRPTRDTAPRALNIVLAMIVWAFIGTFALALSGWFH